jgi:hypothetical protein
VSGSDQLVANFTRNAPAPARFHSGSASTAARPSGFSEPVRTLVVSRSAVTVLARERESVSGLDPRHGDVHRRQNPRWPSKPTASHILPLPGPHDAKGQAVVSEKLGVPEGVAELGE